jgi:diguanylate cyclase (GGDEF)-like protein/PAS domain S-box-containing protein
MWATAGTDELKALTDVIGHGVSVIEVCGDRLFKVLSINRRTEEITGLTHSQVSGLYMDELLPPASAETLLTIHQRCIDEARPVEYEENMDFPAGRVCWRTILSPIIDDRGQVVRLLASATDIASRQQAESELRQTTQALRENEKRLQAAVIGAQLGVWDWDLRAKTIWQADDWAPELQTFEGPTLVPIDKWIELIHPDHREAAATAAERVIRGTATTYSIEWRFRTKDNRWTWRQVYGTVTEHDDAGRPVRISGIYRDITEQKKNQEELQRLTAELQHRAVHDCLTGALNRGAIIDVLEKELARAQREKTVVTVALIDADHFKAINDTHGHLVGDYTLREVVHRIRDVLRPYDHLGRYGGEEFLVVAPAKDGIVGLHERIRDAVAATPFQTSAGELTITVSIGVAASDDGTTHADQLILRADEALYRAKEEGRNRVVSMVPTK